MKYSTGKYLLRSNYRPNMVCLGITVVKNRLECENLS